MLQTNFNNKISELQSKSHNDEILLSMFERKLNENQELCIIYQNQLNEINKKNEYLQKKMNDLKYEPNFIEQAINQLIEEADTEKGLRCPLLIICKGQVNCRTGKRHKTLESCPFFKISETQKGENNVKETEKDKIPNDLSIQITELNSKITYLENQLENKKNLYFIC